MILFKRLPICGAVVSLLILTHAAVAESSGKPGYDTVLANGRVMDPQSGLDAIRYVGIQDGKIAAISSHPLSAKNVIDVRGLVVAPGFIDLHAHGQDFPSNKLQAQDGVTTALELEIGVYPVASWYAVRQGKNLINYGATVGHEGARRNIMSGGEPGASDSDDSPGSARWSHGSMRPEELDELAVRFQQGLDEGALGVGFGLAYTPGATREEIWRSFALAARNGVITYVHMRFGGTNESDGSVTALQEVLSDAASTGAELEVAHIGSTGRQRVPFLLQMIDSAQRNGVNIHTEVYPWDSASTAIGSAIFDEGWQSRVGATFSDLEWAQTGERLTAESFARFRKEQPRGSVIAHIIPSEMVDFAVAHPDVIIISDGLSYQNGPDHPRGAGTFSRVLGRYVRERHVLSLMEALSKMTYLPAQRLEKSVPQMLHKGRLQVGADADITVFDPDKIVERATYKDPMQPAAGISDVLVAGTFIIRDSQFINGVFPGQAIRRAPKTLRSKS